MSAEIGMYCAECDAYISDGAASLNKLEEQIKKAGWYLSHDKDMCPDCRKEWLEKHTGPDQ